MYTERPPTCLFVVGMSSLWSVGHMTCKLSGRKLIYSLPETSPGRAWNVSTIALAPKKVEYNLRRNMTG